jgi:hypothetical protein
MTWGIFDFHFKNYGCLLVKALLEEEPSSLDWLAYKAGQVKGTYCNCFIFRVIRSYEP